MEALYAVIVACSLSAGPAQCHYMDVPSGPFRRMPDCETVARSYLEEMAPDLADHLEGSVHAVAACATRPQLNAWLHGIGVK